MLCAVGYNTKTDEQRRISWAVAGYSRRGMLLVVVLVIITMLALLGSGFSFRMNADLAAVNALQDMQQARLAAESGINRAILLLRENRTNMDEWYDNHSAFRRMLVWAPGKIGASDELADQEKEEGRPAWRCSIVAPIVLGDETTIRFGLTDEAGKVNLNTASRAQLLALFDQLELEDVIPDELADTLIDWRDKDNTPVSPNGAESEYYSKLDPPYKAKNGPLETVEELLMIKNFNGRILFGEDYNRNGHLDENEDDGPEGAFPPDDGDSEMDRGLLHLVTVYSWDWNTANDNRQRMNMEAVKVVNLDEIAGEVGGEKSPEAAKLDGYLNKELEFITEELGVEVIEFISEARSRGYKFRSVGELLGLEVFEDGSSNYDDLWKKYNEQLKELEQAGKEKEEELPTGRGEEDKKEADADGDEGESDKEGASESDEDGTDTSEDESGTDSSDKDKDEKKSKKLRRNRAKEVTPRGGGDAEATSGGRGSRSGSTRQPEGSSGDPSSGAAAGEGAKGEKGTPIISPVTSGQMPIIMDRLTVMKQPVLPGLINVNTAPAEVLMTIPGLTPQDVESIVAQRQQLDGEDKMTIGWLVANNALPPETFALVCNQLTTRSIQFTIDAIGFADHVGVAKRIQVVVEMRGHLSQLKYYRDISSLGMGFPVWRDEGSDDFAFADR